MITLTYEYKLKPTKQQAEQIDHDLEMCRHVWNYALKVTTQVLYLGFEIFKTPSVVLIDFILASEKSRILNKSLFSDLIENRF